MANVLVTGANRGIGLEFVRQLLDRGDGVFAACRDPDNAAALQRLGGRDLTILSLDVADPNAAGSLSSALAGKAIDLFINNAGVYGEFQDLARVREDEWRQVFLVNTIAPLLLTRALLPCMGKGGKLVYLSSKMGSIAENTSGSGYVYRSSKTALNQVVKSLAIDLAPRGLLVAALHPGWVLTDMGGPNALIDTTTSVAGLLGVIDGLEAAGSGLFYDYTGQVLPW